MPNTSDASISSNNIIQTRAPAKLILSGEHAVVQGAPAIAIALKNYAYASVEPASQIKSLIHFHFKNLSHTASRTRQALSKLNHRLQTDYKKFKSGELDIKDVLKKPFELLEHVASKFQDKYQNTPKNYTLNLHSDIPTGSGLGSSAASIIATNWALNLFHNQHISLEECINLSQSSENLQHGQSSGLDCFISAHGGAWLYQNTQQSQLAIHPNILNLPIFWAHMGKPESTTGECVIQSQKIFNQNPSLISDFSEVTLKIAQLLESPSSDLFNHLKNLIKENHHLLTQLNIIPDQTQQLILDLESQQCAAKICGAGNIKGNNAGVILLLGEKNKLNPILKKYNINQIHPLEIDTEGVKQL